MSSENAALREAVKTLKHQRAWFKRQLFGQKSERRQLIDAAVQPPLTGWSEQADAAAESIPTETLHHPRRKAKARSDECVTDQDLRFDDTVPVAVIELCASELSGPEADQYIVIDEKVTRRLAPRPGSYVVLEYHRPVVEHLPSQTLSGVAAPTAV